MKDLLQSNDYDIILGKIKIYTRDADILTKEYVFSAPIVELLFKNIQNGSLLLQQAESKLKNHRKV